MACIQEPFLFWFYFFFSPAEVAHLLAMTLSSGEFLHQQITQQQSHRAGLWQAVEMEPKVVLRQKFLCRR